MSVRFGQLVIAPQSYASGPNKRDFVALGKASEEHPYSYTLAGSATPQSTFVTIKGTLLEGPETYVRFEPGSDGKTQVKVTHEAYGLGENDYFENNLKFRLGDDIPDQFQSGPPNNFTSEVKEQIQDAIDVYQQVQGHFKA